jgi:hypothetical protein
MAQLLKKVRFGRCGLEGAVWKVRFGQSPSPTVYAGGALIVAGGLVVVFWKG